MKLLQDLLAEAVEWDGCAIDAGLDSFEQISSADVELASRGLCSETLPDSLENSGSSCFFIKGRCVGRCAEFLESEANLAKDVISNTVQVVR